jgi:hypothetical protein
MTYQLKHIRGVPYFLKGKIIHTFELDNGLPSEQCVAIGTYDEASDSITYYENWFEHVEPHLEAFRSRIQVIERSKLRETVDKPQKQRKAASNQRKTTRANNIKSE